jgi:hypothetical protein
MRWLRDIRSGLWRTWILPRMKGRLEAHTILLALGDETLFRAQEALDCGNADEVNRLTAIYNGISLSMTALTEDWDKEWNRYADNAI